MECLQLLFEAGSADCGTLRITCQALARDRARPFIHWSGGGLTGIWATLLAVTEVEVVFVALGRRTASWGRLVVPAVSHSGNVGTSY